MKKSCTPKTLSRKFDPTTLATIYVAIITLLSGVSVAALNNADKLWASHQTKDQSQEIITLQDHRYEDVAKALDMRVKEAQEDVTASPDQKRLVQDVSYLQSNANTKAVVAKKHDEFKAAIRIGDYFTANLIKTDINRYLGDDDRGFKQLNPDKSMLPLVYCVVRVDSDL